jgi:hypothetical protein
MINKVVFLRGELRRKKRNTLLDVIKNCPVEILDEEGNHPELNVTRYGNSGYRLALTPITDGKVRVEVDSNPETLCKYTDTNFWKGIRYKYKHASGTVKEYWLRIDKKE